MLKLICEDYQKDFFGMYRVGVLINGKPYNYPEVTSIDFSEFMRLKRRNPGEALNILKKSEVKKRRRPYDN
jgi:hypothetical protein